MDNVPVDLGLFALERCVDNSDRFYMKNGKFLRNSEKVEV